ncbi:hypothetical protein GIB67_008275 [Kingdonia uniflora]|uniref:Uncharacterized protein n=1 Tax=Kingdonia uniflora TaxID=39325 RepID=A0A7J7N4U2_9MAGN|nr:hypothetical protein GIB67_008275 [Kingdonia uniflora]
MLLQTSNTQREREVVLMVEAVLKQRTTSKAMMMTSSSSSTNFFKRIVTQMGMHVRRKGQMGERFDSKELYNLCVYLARAIDNAVSNNEVPTDTRELALLLKQVCKHNKEFPLDVQAAIMMLMISAKRISL